MTLADGTGIASLGVAILALVLAGFALWRGNRNTSAATAVTLNDGLRQGWQRFLSAPTDEAKNYELAELMNLMELTAAILCEGSFAGHSRKIMEEYLCLALSLFEADDDVRSRIAAMRHSPTTFEYLRRFLGRSKRNGSYGKFGLALSANLSSKPPPGQLPATPDEPQAVALIEPNRMSSASKAKT